METNKGNRVPLDDEMVAEVTGGMLTLKNVDGVYVVQLRDGNFNIVESYPVVKSVRTVNTLLQEKYWEFEAGKRDVQMLDYLRENGYI